MHAVIAKSSSCARFAPLSRVKQACTNLASIHCCFVRAKGLRQRELIEPNLAIACPVFYISAWRHVGYCKGTFAQRESVLAQLVDS